VVQLLLQHGADVHAVNDEGYHALLYASENGHAAIVELLLQHGAVMELDDEDEDVDEEWEELA
jgi:ankyrin repeat protein